jgi:AAA ATPase domain
VPVFGRYEAIDAVARSDARVLLVTGDTGVGKSEVLLRAQERAADRAVATAPITLDASPGNLQRGLLAALADAVAVVAARRGDAGEIGRRLSTAAAAFARAQLHELAKALGAEVLALARARLGPEVGHALEAYVEQLRATAGETVAARINAASDPSIAETLVALAGEVAALAEGRPILLALDAAERLHDADRHVVADLIRPLPDGVRVRLAFSTHQESQRHAVDTLVAAGAWETPLAGLDVAAVAEWLAAEGLDAGLAERVGAATGGYPLHVQAVIAELRAGGSIVEAPLHRRFLTLTQLSWNELDRDARVCARRLAVLPAPLPEHELLAVTELSPAELGDALERLRRGFILSTIVNGRPWFHEQRRAFVLGQLGDAERADASARAAEAVLHHLQETLDFSWTQPLAQLVAAAPRLLDADPRLRDATELDGDELAVAGGLIELSERNPFLPIDDDAVREGARAAGASDLVARLEVLQAYERERQSIGLDRLLRHVRVVFGIDGDPGDALARLVERGLARLGTAEDWTGDAPRLVPTVTFEWSLPVTATLMGRAASAFARMPVPSVRNMLFDLVLRRPLGAYDEVWHGLGRAPWSWTPPGGAPFCVTAAGDVGGRRLWCIARYRGESERDAAAERLRGLTVEVLGERLALHEAIVHPEEAVPAERFLRAAERASADAPAEYEGREAMRLRARTIELVAGLASPRERVALELAEPIALHWLLDEGRLLEAEVAGGGWGSVEHPGVSAPDDPIRLFALIEAFEHGDTEIVAVRELSDDEWRRSDPVLDAIGRLSRRAVQFNQGQLIRPLPWPLAVPGLRDVLLAARTQALADARALALVSPDRRRPPQPELLEIVFEHAEEEGPVRAHYRTAPADAEEVRVSVERRAHPSGELAQDVVAFLLGHAVDEVQFTTRPLDSVTVGHVRSRIRRP